MANYLRYVVLDVGQGSGNWMEIRDETTDKLVSTVLIDLGSERAPKSSAGGPSVEYVVNALNEMDDPTINVLIFSHSDSDHINLLQDVLASFEPEHLDINYVYYGGDYARYQKRNKNILDTVQAYMPDTNKLKSMAYQYTDFDDGANSKPIITVSSDLKLYMLIANAANESSDNQTKKRKLDSFAINSNSVVVAAIFKGVGLVATGDATGVTLAECNDKITTTIHNTFFNNTFMLTMPHHGSATTTFDVRGYEGEAEDYVQEFSDNISAQTITASAERVRTFKHPSALVMSYFWANLSSTVYYAKDPLLATNDHFYTAFFEAEGWSKTVGGMKEDWPDDSWWFTVQTAQNVFTNLYYDWLLQGGIKIPPNPGEEVAKFDYKKKPQPPLGVAWEYAVSSTGAKTMDRIVNRPSLLRLRAAILDRVPPRELPIPTHEQLQRETEAMKRIAAAPPSLHIAPVLRGPSTAQGAPLRSLRVIP